MDCESFYIEKMQLPEIKETANILTDAFKTNPAYSLIFNKTDLQEGLIRLFETSLFLLNRRQISTRLVKEKDSGATVGTFTLVPPEDARRSFNDYLQADLPGFIYKFGISTLYRMISLDNCNKKTLLESMKSKEYYCLSMVVVKEQYRGMGIGSFAIKSCLDELLEAKKDCHLLGLTTQLPENVSFYSRLGFEIIGEGEIYIKKSHYYNWNMKYVLV
ncbi:MAG: GNAT family N-acetyltransferase [Tannerella sp.]|nr:GNAT family N-acetyltransferase [Tannerella sp.]